VRHARIRSFPAAALGALLALAPLAAVAEHHEGTPASEESAGEGPPTQEWNQERMTELSGELATAMAELRRTFRKDPMFRNPRSPNQRAVHNMEQTLRNLELSTRTLSNRVKGGGGLEDTQGTARRIGMLLNDADMWGRRIMTSAWVQERVQPAMKLINEIAPYYGSGPLYDPETMQRLDRAPDPQAPPPDPGKPEGS
jgi:hypothetical protein